MDKIKVLEEIGLKKVSEETHIEQKYIKYMVDFDFEKLNRINTLGFVKILSREYNLDLSDWSEAFEEYWHENHNEEEENNGLFIVVDDTKKSRKFLGFLLLLLLGSIISIFVAIFQDKIDLENYMNSDESTYEQASIVEETQKSLDEANNSIQEEDIAITTQEDVEDASEDMQIELNTTVETVTSENIETEEAIKITDVNEIIDVEKKTELNELEEKVEVLEKENPRFSKEAILVPNTELWLGLIYLDDKKRRSYLGEGNFSIDISRDQIITTGHGSFNLNIEDEIRAFKRQAPMRFLVKDGNITEISWSKFKELNEGKSW